MLNWIKIGTIIFVVGIAGFGAQHIFYGRFISGRAPVWPEGVPGEVVWAYLSGLLLIATALSILLKKKARQFTLACAAMIFIWGVVRHIPLAMQDSYFGGVTTSAFKALMLLGGFLALAASLPEEEGPLTGKFFETRIERWLVPVGRIMVGLFFIVCGIQHFIWIDFVQALVPGWIPGKIFWSYFAGVALFAAGIGLVINVKAHLAALLSGLMVFIWLLVLHIPRAIVGWNDSNEWIAVFEATTFSGAFLVLAGMLPERTAVGMKA